MRRTRTDDRRAFPVCRQATKRRQAQIDGDDAAAVHGVVRVWPVHRALVVSLEALGRVLYADIEHDCFRVLAHLASMSRMTASELNDTLGRLTRAGLIEPTIDAPLDMLDGTEGFRLLIDEVESTFAPERSTGSVIGDGAPGSIVTAPSGTPVGILITVEGNVVNRALPNAGTWHAPTTHSAEDPTIYGEST